MLTRVQPYPQPDAGSGHYRPAHPPPPVAASVGHRSSSGVAGFRPGDLPGSLASVVGGTDKKAGATGKTWTIRCCWLACTRHSLAKAFSSTAATALPKCFPPPPPQPCQSGSIHRPHSLAKVVSSTATTALPKCLPPPHKVFPSTAGTGAQVPSMARARTYLLGPAYDVSGLGFQVRIGAQVRLFLRPQTKVPLQLSRQRGCVGA